MVQYLNCIGEKAAEICFEKWEYVVEELDEIEQKWTSFYEISQLQSKKESNFLSKPETEENSEKNSEQIDKNTDEIDKENIESLISLLRENEIDDEDDDVDEVDVEDIEHGVENNITEEINIESNEKCIEDNTAVDISDECDASNFENEIEEKSVPPLYHCTSMLKRIKSIKNQFIEYLTQLPVMGFNSGRYDQVLIKQYLSNEMELHVKNEKRFTVKRNNSYLCISNKKIKFLDLIQFLTPSTSYKDFLKAYNIPECKGLFPYEYLTSFSVLYEEKLPPIEAFYSSLKKKNILDEGHSKYQELLEKGMSEKEALNYLQLDSVPKTIEENYNWLQSIWKKHNMKTLVDLLEWYNVLDVKPGISAISQLLDFFHSINIDLFKNCISCPGASRQMLFREAKKNEAYFPLLGGTNKDLYKKIRSSCIGGPSIIFKRLHKKHETTIRNNPSKICGNVVGFDVNALYLHSMSLDLPQGAFVRRREETIFEPEFSDDFLFQYYWLDWVMKTTNKHIIHKMNNGKEIKIGLFAVDGFEPATNTIWEYNGCLVHGHSCINTTNEKFKTLMADKRKRTEERIAYFKARNYNIQEMWHCQFQNLIENDKELENFINEKRPNFFRKYPHKVSDTQIRDAVLQDELFGIIEVDLEVPEKYPHYTTKANKNMSPKEYFSEFCPIFTNSEITFEDYSPHMQEFCKERGITPPKKRLLLSGMSGERILLTNSLLKWYLEHGLKITRIYEVIEFTPAKPFLGFVEQVSSARRKADMSSEYSNFGNVWKLVGNSGYGSLLIQKDKHRDVMYVKGKPNACKLISDPKFYNATELSEEYYEIEMRKKRIILDTPVYLAFFILCYAKQRMLEFYYEFMDKYIDRSNFEYLEMDTDSAYISLSSNSIEEIIKPSMKDKYEEGIYGLCKDNPGKADCSLRWFPRQCCKKHFTFDKREPGLLKLEATGTEMVCLASKTYVLFNSEKNNSKLSCKGISKSTIENPLEIFNKVLKNKQSVEGENVGFRCKNNTIFTYALKRTGFNYLYVKRKVKENGIDTFPLEKTLTPWTKEELDCLNERCGMRCELKFFCKNTQEWRKKRSIKKYYAFLKSQNFLCT
jgi:hypothetical protein